MKLYEIDIAIQALIDGAVDEETGEVKEIDREELGALQMEREKKLEGVALGVKNLSAEAAAIKAEEDRLEKRRKVLENKADRLKAFLMENIGSEKLETARVKVSVRQSSVKTTVIDDAALIDKWYWQQWESHTADEDKAEWNRITELAGLNYPDPTFSKTGLKKLLEDYEIPGVHLEDGKPSLRIV